MTRTVPESQSREAEFKSYVEDMVLDALHSGTVSPKVLLECLYYALEPDLLAAIRGFATLGPAERLMLMSYAKRLSDEEGS